MTFTTTAILLLLCSLLSSCTSITGTDPGGAKYAYHSLGGDAKDLHVTPGGATAATINNSKSLISSVKTIGTVVGTSLVVDGFTKGKEITENGLTSRTATTEATKSSAAAGKEATKQAQIAADLKMAEMEMAAPTVP